ncbi:YihY/virulence factor BrkB family protein [Winogradskyella litorisediminis]|uniref:YihY/virulence factor BrkB family protein n=1 Tax=Winogradskyella litorisediminis TaxID=1156618 RepID=A0ABW3N7E2_9FLAO
MAESIEDSLKQIPVVKNIVVFLQKIELPGLDGLTLYDLLELYGLGIVKGTLTARASAIAFSFFTAIFPFLLFVIILIPLIPIEGFPLAFQDFLQTFLPPQTSDFFMGNIFENLKSNEQAGLLSSVFLLSMFLMANGVSAVFSGFENSYHKQLVRSIFKQYMYAFGVALILAFLVLFTVAVFFYTQIYIITPLYETFSGRAFEDGGLGYVQFGKYLFFVIMTYIGIATLYYFGTKDGRESRFFSIGALFTTLLIMLTSFLFGVYIDNFSRYNELYGSIGALLILLLYLWLNANILLLGYELNATIRGLHKINLSEEEE